MKKKIIAFIWICLVLLMLTIILIGSVHPEYTLVEIMESDFFVGVLYACPAIISSAIAAMRG